MANVIKMRIQFRRDTTENWLLNKDVIPAAGEPCYDLNLKMLKIGDGVTTYENLPVIGNTNIEVSADGKSIVLDDGVFKLMGFDTAEVGAQPRKAANGNIEWVVPVDVAALQTTVTGLQTDVANLQTEVATLQEIVNPSDDDAIPLLSRIETLETKMDGIDEGSVDAKIDAKINEFANQISDDGTVNTLKELIGYVANHGGELETIVADITDLQTRVGNEPVHEQIATAIKNSGHITKDEASATLLSKVEATATLKHVKYEISHKPVGTLVDYRDKEIRVMVPSDTKFELQNSGANTDANSYYIGLKAYAPEGAVSFKEDLAEIISDNTMYYFEDNDFAGIDAYGRKYSICWLPVAKYDEEAKTWHRYGDQSTKEKYLGFYYSVEWYDANGVKIDSDCIRVNLSNETCHNNIEPYYMANVVKEVAVNGTLLDVVDGRVDISIAEHTLGVKGSDEIDVAEDGTLSIKSISFDKIVQDSETIIVMDGGSAV